MAHKLKLIFLLSLILLSIFGTTSFASVQLTEQNAQKILDYFSSNLNSRFGGTFTEENLTVSKNILKNTDAQNFAEFFNSNFDNTLAYEGDYEFENLTIFGCTSPQNAVLLYFVLSNNSYHSDLPYLYSYFYNSGDGLYSYYLSGKQGNVEKPSIGAYIRISNEGIMTCQRVNTFAQYIYTTEEFKTDTPESFIKANCFLGLSPIQIMYYAPQNNISNAFPYFLNKTLNFNEGTGEESGDTGGGIISSGDTGGGTTNYPDYSQDLDNIQTGIIDINNNIGETNNKLDNISGELSNINNNLTTVPDISDTTITNQDIISSLGFEFMEDPYSNFWLELTTGLSGALTNNIRTLDINWLGYIYTIDLDKIGLKYPPAMELILKSTSTVAIVWILVKWWKIIVDKLASGNMDEVLAMNEEERNC